MLIEISVSAVAVILVCLLRVLRFTYKTTNKAILDLFHKTQHHDATFDKVHDILRDVDKSMNISNRALFSALRKLYPDDFEKEKAYYKIKKKFKAPKRKMSVRHKGRLYSVGNL